MEPWEDPTPALASWGVPHELMDYAQFSHVDTWVGKLPPHIVLSTGWVPAGAPNLASVVDGVSRGMGLSVQPGCYFDFRWLGDGLPFVSSLECWGHSDSYSGHESIGMMGSLSSLIALESPVDVDLSHLRHLRMASVSGLSLISVGAAPAIRSLHISLKRNSKTVLPADVTFSPSIASLGLAGGVIDLSVLEQLAGLQELDLREVDTVDLAPIGDCKDLEKLSIYHCKRVRGVNALLGLPSLRELVLGYVDDIDQRESLLQLEIERFEGIGRGFDADFSERAQELDGVWFVQPSRSTRTSRK